MVLPCRHLGCVEKSEGTGNFIEFDHCLSFDNGHLLNTVMAVEGDGGSGRETCNAHHIGLTLKRGGSQGMAGYPITPFHRVDCSECDQICHYFPRLVLGCLDF